MEMGFYTNSANVLKTKQNDRKEEETKKTKNWPK